jgi:WXG100 family type VII secretion target
MPVDTVQAQYDHLESIAQRFGQWAESNTDLCTRVRQSVENLMNGGWEGRGADAFFSEMGSEVLPAIDRLSNALQEGQGVIRWIISILQEAEQEAASAFGDRSTGSRPSFASQPGTVEAKASRSVNVKDTMEFIEQWEGRRQTMYIDERGRGRPRTIGVGFNLERADARAKIEAVGANFEDVLAGRQSLSNQQINALLRSDVEHSIRSARDLVRNFDQLPNEAQTMVVDMVFNMGRGGFAKFRKTISALEAQDFARAADEMQDSKWYREGGHRPKHHVQAMRALARRPSST